VISAPDDDFLFATALAVDAPHVWVTDFNHQYQATPDSMGRLNSVTELSSSNGSLVQVISAPADRLHDPDAIAAKGPCVWVANVNSITELNASTGALVRVIASQHGDIERPVAIAVHDSLVWVLNDDSITELNASTGELVRVIETGVAATYEPLGITASGRHVWVAWVNPRTSVDAVSEFLSTNGSLVRLIDAPTDGFNFNAPVALTSNAAHVWVANIDSITELTTSDGSLVRVITGRSHGLFSPEAITVSGPHLWIDNWAGSVTELTTSNAALVRVVG
jgi:hypothetical protein